MAVLPIAMILFAFLLFIRGIVIFTNKQKDPGKQALGIILLVLAMALALDALSSQ